MKMKGKEFIENIRKSIEADKGGRIWTDAVNALSLLSGAIFSRSSHFIMELIQNCEDAGLGLSHRGEMTIKISRKRVLVVHNARPFNYDDVNAICGIRTTKKPELGTVGYLGIGFKSVFKITDSPHIFSGEFKFKFDKNAWEKPDETPWQIIPLHVDELPEQIDPQKTTFYLPFRDEKTYEEAREEIKNLGLHLYFFLKWLKRIEIIDEESGETTILENLGEQNGIVTLDRNGVKERYLVFRRICEVPVNVAEDKTTKEAKRSNVKKREVMVAFKIDENNNLVPVSGAEAYGGVYSFLPLSEERSGARFLVQGDFIVVPGRESINYEALWNHWLIEQIAELVKEAIETFKQNPVWRQQYLSLFEFTPFWGQPSFEKLFNPKLHQPLQQYLQDSESIPTYDGKFAKPEDAVVTEDLEDLFTEEDLKKVFREIKNPRKISSKTELGPFGTKVHRLNILKIRDNKDFLQEKTKEPNAIEWFEKYYRKLWEHGRSPIWVLTENLEIRKEEKVFFKTIPPEVIELSKNYPEVKEILNSLPFLHPILGAKLYDFFATCSKIKKVDLSTICKDRFLPEILTENSSPPKKDELIAYTCLLQKAGISISGTIWVLTKNNNIKPSNEVFFSEEYRPAQNWERNKKYIPGIEFLSTEYLRGSQNIEEINAWRKFFLETKVKEHGDRTHMEKFSINFTQEKLKDKNIKEKLGYYFIKLDDVREEKRGYDFSGETDKGEEKYLEIKSLSKGGNIELTPNEAEKAEIYKDDYLLCIVDGIPENPELYLLPNPLKHGKKEKVTIHEEVWRGFKL